MTAPRSESEIESEIDRIENAFETLDADLDQTFELEAYLKGLKFALNQFNPPTKNLPSVETLDAIVSEIQSFYPGNRVYVKRESTPPNYDHVGVIMEVEIDSAEEWENYSDTLSEIAREHETEDELVYTRAKRLRDENDSTRTTTD